MSLDLVVLGNLLVDDMVFEDGRTRMGEAGGAVLYACLGARLWGLHVGAVTLRGDDYPELAMAALRERGVALDGVHPLGQPGLRTWLLYEGARRQVVHRLDRITHAQASPALDRIPAAWADARAFHLAPMPLESQRELVTALAEREAFLSVDPYAPLGPATLQAWHEILPRVDALFLSEDEMELLDADSDLASLAGGRLRYIVFKRGARGGTLYDLRDGQRVPWAARADAALDPTGAGDAFAAGVLAGWLRGEPHASALERGVVGASFALHGWGPSALLRATEEQAEERRRKWFGRD